MMCVLNLQIYIHKNRREEEGGRGGRRRREEGGGGRKEGGGGGHDFTYYPRGRVPVGVVVTFLWALVATPCSRLILTSEDSTVAL